MKIAEISGSGSLWDAVAGDFSACTSVAAAAQRFTDGFYDYFNESTVLVRVFVTVPFGRLPEREQTLARGFSAQFSDAPPITEETAVLTLLGTRGTQPAWNARTDSNGHGAIPLINDAFVGEIPMIARVLAETGFTPLLRSGGARSQYVTRWKDEADGLFFIGDARVTTDERGRLIIPATEFVTHYGVRTVFGFGGPYATARGASGARTFVTAIVFSRDTLLRMTAAHFVPLIGEFKTRTLHLLRDDALFS